MRIFQTIFLLVVSLHSFAQSESMIEGLVKEAIQEMPAQGGYELTAKPPRALADAFRWQEIDELMIDQNKAIPSYCTTATYVIFYKVLQKYWAHMGTKPSQAILDLLKPKLEGDGQRMWGRWNSNGPGTSKLVHDAELGENFDDIKLAKSGDFLKIFWNMNVGRKESGHSVIFLREESHKGEAGIRFWASSASTSGYGEKWIPLTQAKRFIFTRLTHLENAENLARIPETDAFLESMLTRDSSWEEVRSVTGM